MRCARSIGELATPCRFLGGSKGVILPCMIETERLILRRARMEDVEDMHRLFSHPEVMHYRSCLPHDDIAQTRAFVRGTITSI